MYSKSIATATIAVAVMALIALPLCCDDAKADGAPGLEQRTVVSDIAVTDDTFSFDGYAWIFSEGRVVYEAGSWAYFDGSFSLDSDTSRCIILLKAGSNVVTDDGIVTVQQDREVFLDGSLSFSESSYEESGTGSSTLTVDIDGELRCDGYAISGSAGKLEYTRSSSYTVDRGYAVEMTTVTADFDAVEFPVTSDNEFLPLGTLISVYDLTVEAYSTYDGSDGQGDRYHIVELSAESASMMYSLEGDDYVVNASIFMNDIDISCALTEASDGGLTIAGAEDDRASVSIGDIACLTEDLEGSRTYTYSLSLENSNASVSASLDPNRDLVQAAIGFEIDTYDYLTGSSYSIDTSATDTSGELRIDGDTVGVSATVATQIALYTDDVVSVEGMRMDTEADRSGFDSGYGIFAFPNFITELNYGTGTVAVDTYLWTARGSAYEGWGYAPYERLTNYVSQLENGLDTVVTAETADYLCIDAGYYDGSRIAYHTEHLENMTKVFDLEAGTHVSADVYRVDSYGLSGTTGYMEATGFASVGYSTTEGDFVFSLDHDTYDVLNHLMYIEHFDFVEGMTAEFLDSYMVSVYAYGGDLDGTAHFCVTNEPFWVQDRDENGIDFFGTGYDAWVTFEDDEIAAAGLDLCTDMVYGHCFSSLPPYRADEYVTPTIAYDLSDDGASATLSELDGLVFVEADGSDLTLVIDGEERTYTYRDLDPIEPSDEREGYMFMGWYDGYEWFTAMSEVYYPVLYDATITEIWVPESYAYVQSGDVLVADIGPDGFFMGSADDILAAAGDARYLEVRNDIGSVFVEMRNITPGSTISVVMTEVTMVPFDYIADIIGDGTVYRIGACVEDYYDDGSAEPLPFHSTVPGEGQVRGMDNYGVACWTSVVTADDGTRYIDEEYDLGGFYIVYGDADDEGSPADDDTLLYPQLCTI